MKMVYARVYDQDDEILCIVRAPDGASLGLVEEAVSQALNVCRDEMLIGRPLLTDAEAESLIEMKVCHLVDLSEIPPESLMPIQGYRDENGRPIQVRYG